MCQCAVPRFTAAFHMAATGGRALPPPIVGAGVEEAKWPPHSSLHPDNSIYNHSLGPKNILHPKQRIPSEASIIEAPAVSVSILIITYINPPNPKYQIQHPKQRISSEANIIEAKIPKHLHLSSKIFRRSLVCRRLTPRAATVISLFPKKNTSHTTWPRQTRDTLPRRRRGSGCVTSATARGIEEVPCSPKCKFSASSANTFAAFIVRTTLLKPRNLQPGKPEAEDSQP